MIKSSGQYFKQILKTPNFMTPKLVAYYQSGDYEVEVSRGTFGGEVIYGVTVVNAVTLEHEHELGEMCRSYAEAKAYIKGLGK